MKQKILKCTVTAAMLTLVATAAYGQYNSLIAKIPFAFRAVGSDLPAGRYGIAPPSRAVTGSGIMQLRNLDTGKSVLIQVKNSSLTERKEGRPRLIFQCGGEDGCSLATLWSGTGSGMEFSTPALSGAQRERRETVYLDRFKEK